MRERAKSKRIGDLERDNMIERSKREKGNIVKILKLKNFRLFQ